MSDPFDLFDGVIRLPYTFEEFQKACPELAARMQREPRDPKRTVPMPRRWVPIPLDVNAYKMGHDPTKLVAEVAELEVDLMEEDA